MVDSYAVWWCAKDIFVEFVLSMRGSTICIKTDAQSKPVYGCVPCNEQRKY